MELCNTIIISGIVKKIYPLHYSPAGVCLHRFVLEHLSYQLDNNVKRQIKLSLFCIVLDAQDSQIKLINEGETVKLKGYLNQNTKSQIVMHVSSIQILKKDNI